MFYLEYDMHFMLSKPRDTYVQKKEFWLKRFIFLDKNKITDYICLINHGIFLLSML